MFKKNSKLTKNKWGFLFLLGLAFAVWFFILLTSNNHFGDETVHHHQIKQFFKGHYTILPELTTIPGYHLAISSFSNVFSDPTLQNFRLVSLLLSSFSIWIFYFIAKKLQTGDPFIRTLQFIFLPITFLYFPLLYTDIFSLLFVLLAFYFTLKKQFKLSALLSLLSLLIRQNNIVWIVFIWVYGYVSSAGFAFSRKTLIEYFKNTFEYFFVFLAFFVFVFFNKGIAIGDIEGHPTGFYLGNLYFALALTGFLFLPFLLTSLAKFNFAKRKTFLFGAILLGILIAASFMLFPPAIHPYNLTTLKVHFLRNLILQAAYHQNMWLYGLVIFAGFLTLFLLKFEKKNLLLFPFSVLVLLPSFLVEQRYALISFVFLLLFYKEENSKIEKVTIFYWLLISLGLTYMILNLNTFL